MSHFKDKSDNVYHLDDDSFMHLLPQGCVKISEAEANALLTPTLTLVQLQAESWNAIKAERDRRKAGGVKVGDKWFHSDDGSRIQHLALVSLGSNIPAGLQWKTMDGSFTTMTQAVAQDVFNAEVGSDVAIFAVAEQHRIAMEASADPAAYDYSTGWPKIYGE